MAPSRVDANAHGCDAPSGGGLMRVLHVTVEYPPLVYGGLGTAVGGLVEASADGGLEVAVLLVGDGPRRGYDALAPIDVSSLIAAASDPQVVAVGWAEATTAAVDLVRM